MISPLIRNALAIVRQALVGASLLFALYRYINATLGVDQLGVWSVVLAKASASRLADMELSAVLSLKPMTWCGVPAGRLAGVQWNL